MDICASVISTVSSTGSGIKNSPRAGTRETGDVRDRPTRINPLTQPALSLEGQRTVGVAHPTKCVMTSHSCGVMTEATPGVMTPW